MDQLISQITQKTGISDDQARQAVAVVTEYLKQQLPAPLAAQVDSVLGGQGPQGLGNLGGLLGNR